MEAIDRRFEHVVVLMLENRSFDHLFGYLNKPGVDGLINKSVFNYLRAGDSTSTKFQMRKGGDYTAVGQGPSHSLKQTNEQLFGRTDVPPGTPANTALMDGFIASFATSLRYDLKREPTDHELQQAMSAFTPEQLPVLSFLAEQFVLCDRWFADVPGPTMPNRAFVHAATSQGYTYNANWKPDFKDCTTIYDRINASSADKNVSWRVYYHDQNDVLELYPHVEKKATSHVHFEGAFLNDVASDKLATYSFITPAFMDSAQHMVNSMHAPADVRPAEKLVADIYGALSNYEAVFKKTLFIIVFDEHGGYYDHVPPPEADSPDGKPGLAVPSFLVPFNFDRLGLRVPCILVSPWFESAVDHTVYSHASIPGTIIEVFGLGGQLTQRDGKANKLTNYFKKSGEQTWRAVPSLPPVPVQPQRIDATQRDILDGSVHLDPHPENRNKLRTRDINDSQTAGHFMQTQAAKYLEHYMAARRTGKMADELSAPRQLATSMLSESRINELRQTVEETLEPRP